MWGILKQSCDLLYIQEFFIPWLWDLGVARFKAQVEAGFFKGGIYTHLNHNWREASTFAAKEAIG